MTDEGSLAKVISRKELEDYISDTLNDFGNASNQFYDEWREWSKKKKLSDSGLKLSPFISESRINGTSLFRRLNDIVESKFSKLNSHYPSNTDALNRVKYSLTGGLPSYLDIQYERFLACATYFDQLLKEGKYISISAATGSLLPPLVVLMYSVLTNHGKPNNNLDYYIPAIILGITVAVCGYFGATLYNSIKLRKRYEPKISKANAKKLEISKRLAEKALSEF